MINVTRTYLPQFEKYVDKIKELWDNHWITNNGKFVRELGERLKNYLGVDYIVLTANGTLALQIAYKLFGLKGEVITSPFSFAATVSSMVWEGLTPVFVDINSDTLTINVERIEEKITDKTSAIVPVHVYGNACETEKIDKIAKKYNLKVIYDAAHCFGVEYKNKSILSYGDAAILSFHATKVYHTIEGGAIILHNEDDYLKAKRMINFGYEKGKIKALGINAKMNEFEAAMGLCVLDGIDDVIKKRKKIYKYYKDNLKDLVDFPKLNSKITKYNYAYFPIILKSEKQLLKIVEKMKKSGIFPRRYFYPSLDRLNYIKSKENLPIARNISKKILCLPSFDTLENAVQRKIIEVVKSESL